MNMEPQLNKESGVSNKQGVSDEQGASAERLELSIAAYFSTTNNKNRSHLDRIWSYPPIY